MLAAVLAAVAVYFIFLAVHWIPFRLWKVQQRTRTMTMVLLLCLPAGFFAFRFFDGQIPGDLNNGGCAGGLFYGTIFVLLWCGYVQFVFSFDTSPSLRILVVLVKNNGGLTGRELSGRLDFRETFRRRFFRAVDGGAIAKVKLNGTERFVLSAGAVRFARVGEFAKDFFRLGAGG